MVLEDIDVDYEELGKDYPYDYVTWTKQRLWQAFFRSYRQENHWYIKP